MSYALSDDICFQQVGAITKINYFKNFRSYHLWLEKHADTTLGKKIFRYYNERVFADVVIAGHEEEEEEEEDNLSGATPRLDTFEAELVAKFGGEFFLDDEGHSIANPADSGGDFDPQLGEFEITDEESGESDGPPADYPFAMNPADSGEDFGPQLAEIDGEEFSESDDSQADNHFTTAYYQRNRVPTADPRPIPPPCNHIQGLSQTAPVNSTAPSHSTLVHPDAQVAGITTTLRSAEADRARPRGPPAIIATQPRVPAASAVAAQPTQPAVRVKPKSTRGAADRALSPDNSNPIQVLSTVLEEETLTSTRKTRSLSKTTTTTKKVANPRQKKAAAPDPGPSEEREVVSKVKSRASRPRKQATTI